MKLQVPPLGLFSLLGIVGSGERPDMLAKEVRPVIDSFPYYASGRLESALDFQLLATSGTQAVVTVPAGERWAVMNISGLMSAKSGAATSRVAVAYRGDSGIVHWLGEVEGDNDAADVVCATTALPIPFIAPPGADLICACVKIAGAATCTISCAVSFVRLTA